MDGSIVRKAIKGDDEAFYYLINSNKEQLYRIGYSYLKNKDDALEAIQETTFRAYKKIHKLKNPQYFKTWLIRILINYCIDEQARRKKISSFTNNNVSSIEYDKDDKLVVEAVIEKLKPKYREIIVLKYFEDMTISEIAYLKECPEGTIKTRLSRALERLRNILNQGGEYNNV